MRLGAPTAARRLGRFGLRSWQAILVTLGLLIAQAPMLAHLLIVRHVTCEHGELVEGKGHSSREEAAPSDDGDGERALPGGEADAEHEHCDALALRHRPSEGGIHVGEATLLEIERSVALGRGHEARQIPLLSLAPKGSPPAI